MKLQAPSPVVQNWSPGLQGMPVVLSMLTLGPRLSISLVTPRLHPFVPFLHGAGVLGYA